VHPLFKRSNRGQGEKSQRRSERIEYLSVTLCRNRDRPKGTTTGRAQDRYGRLLRNWLTFWMFICYYIDKYQYVV
jgi:hypothetical protein